MKYAAIRAHRSQFPMALMCRALGVSRAGFYAAQTRAASARARRDEQLRAQVRSLHQASRRTYGSPRVHAELRARGERCGRKRVARLMREAGLRVKVGRRSRPQTTDSNHPHRIAPNVLARRFSVAETEGLNRAWAGDITYVPRRAGWLYLAVILDLASRRVVGSLDEANTRRKFGHRRPADGLVWQMPRAGRVVASLGPWEPVCRPGVSGVARPA